MPASPLSSTDARATIELLSDTQIRISRHFAAPAARIFTAMTVPEHVRRWYGPRALQITVCEIDLRIGGRWRYVLTAPDGSAHGFAGEYLEIEAPHRIVSTEYYEPIGADHAFVATVRLDPVDGGTHFTNTITYRSRADRDGHLGAGMEAGMNETFDRLALLLPTLG
jgi:uncharacterized protein YndB with AHSA1/START domain